jgi:tRNA 2-selenouridine synthase
MPLSIREFLALRRDRAVVDVRSPGEYDEGHIRGAFNIPLLNNEERSAVGTAYKQQGQAEAIREGFRRVGPRLPEIIAETEKVAAGREILVHCWRGGMRSNNFCQFAAMAKIRSQSLDGGYKAYRHEALASFAHRLPLVLLGGCTGSGKSEVLRALRTTGEQVLDLEALANHKGSVFGGLFMPPQPTTEQFQNELFEELVQLNPSKRIWVEDESLAVGRIFLPVDFWTQMTQSPLVTMEVDKDVRIRRLVNEYGAADPETFLSIMEKITKKLGGQNFKMARDHLLRGDMAATIDCLLAYYDRTYRESLARRSDRIQKKIQWNGEDAHQAALALSVS